MPQVKSSFFHNPPLTKSYTASVHNLRCYTIKYSSNLAVKIDLSEKKQAYSSEVYQVERQILSMRCKRLVNTELEFTQLMMHISRIFFMTRHGWQDLYQCQLCQSLQCSDFTTLILLYVDTIAHILYFSTSLTSLAAAAQLVMQVQARMSQEMQAFWSVHYCISFETPTCSTSLQLFRYYVKYLFLGVGPSSQSVNDNIPPTLTYSQDKSRMEIRANKVVFDL